VSSPSLGRFTEELPPEARATPSRIILLIIAVLMILSLGGGVAFFLLFHTPYLNNLKPEHYQQADAQLATDREILPFNSENIPAAPRLDTPPPPRLQQHLKPQENEIPEIIDLLRTGYMEPGTILVEKLDQASLQQLVSASDRLVRLSVDPVLSPFRQSRNIIDTLQYNTAYWRPVRLDANTISALVRQWSVWKSAPSPGLIIDLRYFRDGNNFDGAATAMGLFTNPDTPLFSIQELSSAQKIFRTRQQPLSIQRQFPIIVLINSFTRGAGEVLAQLLEEKCQALLIGQSTAGEGGLYTESGLSSGRFLRMASSRVTLSDGTDMLGRPVHPNIKIPVTPQHDVAAYLAGFRRSPASLIQEPDILKTSQIEKDITITQTEDITPILDQTDITLQSAVDIIQAIHHQRSGVPTLIEFEVRRIEAEIIPPSDSSSQSSPAATD
jgi:hypothetical protein